MLKVTKPDDVTPKTARELREALAKIIPTYDHEREEAYFERVKYALYELLAAMINKGQPSADAVGGVMMICAQVQAVAKGHADFADELRATASAIERAAATH